MIEKLNANVVPSHLASIVQHVLTPDILGALRALSAGSGEEIYFADAINVHVQQGFGETVRLNRRRLDDGSVDGFMDPAAFGYRKRNS